MATQPFEQFMDDAADKLRMYLSIVPLLTGEMSEHRSALGFAASLDTFEVLTVKEAHFHPITGNGDLQFVIYNTPAERGYAVYRADEHNSAKEVCVPITIAEVIRSMDDEPEDVQRKSITAMLDKLERLQSRAL